jgi:hypothetical protein
MLHQQSEIKMLYVALIIRDTNARCHAFPY